MHCGHPVIASTPVDDTRFSRLAAVAPETLVEKVLAASGLAGERRVVTILFVDVVGSTALSEQVDVETWTRIMNDVVDQVIPVIYRYEGTIARMLGDSLLAFFGAPVAHEDDPSRAVRAALDIINKGKAQATELRKELGIEFALRTCIHTGTVIINSVSDNLKYEFTAMGGAVNLTSRIKFAAKPMTIVITEHTHRFIDPIFDCTALEPVSVKGWKEPVRVYRVDGVRLQPGRLRGIQGLVSPMVGRDAELKALNQLCDTVRAGLGRAVIIVGEPGLGKTRLIAEWRADVGEETKGNPPIWAEGRCLSFGQGLAYHLLINLLRSLFGISDNFEETEAHTIVSERISALFGDEMMEIYPYIGDLLSLDLEPEARALVSLPDPQVLQTHYYQAVRRLLESLAERQPVVLVLEDLHWADPSSVDILVRLFPVTSLGAVLVCLVTRDERDTSGWRMVNMARETMAGSLSELTLVPLSENDSRKMVANLLEIEALPEQVRKIILKKSEGNPFFVEEVVRMLIDQGAIVRSDQGWVAGVGFDNVKIPDNLQGLLLARIDRLPDDVKMILRVASVIGRKFPVQVLEQVLMEDIQ
jgi:class 3 adenylate cyclase